MDWDSPLVGGSFFTGVVIVEVPCGAYTCQGRTKQKDVPVRVYLQESVDWQMVPKLTVFSFLVQQNDDGWVLIQTEQGRFFGHRHFQATELLKVKEACCGIGALGRGLSFLGFRVVAQNDVQEVTVREATRLSGATPVLGDISQPRTVFALWDSEPGDCTLAAGVACQPYSRLGDRRSCLDERASTLPGTLRAGYFMQCSCVVLECVPQVQDDPWVQQVLEDYAKVTGQVCHQTLLSLHQVWAARRERWWCVIAVPDVAPASLVSWKPHGPWHSISDVMDCFNVGAEDEAALTLAPDECEAYAALKPLASYCIQVNQPLPTALHSWGSALAPCPCGCRSAPFRWERLQKSGICAVLVPSTGLDGSRRFRFPSAAETALLCGLTPCLDYGAPRLSLALVGQLASPLQSAWVGVQVAKRLSLLQVSFPRSLDGVQVLHTQRRLLLKDAEIMGYRPFTAEGPLSHCPSIVYETHAQLLRRKGLSGTGVSSDAAPPSAQVLHAGCNGAPPCREGASIAAKGFPDPPRGVDLSPPCLGFPPSPRGLDSTLSNEGKETRGRKNGLPCPFVGTCAGSFPGAATALTGFPSSRPKSSDAGVTDDYGLPAHAQKNAHHFPIPCSGLDLPCLVPADSQRVLPPSPSGLDLTLSSGAMLIDEGGQDHLREEDAPPRPPPAKRACTHDVGSGPSSPPILFAHRQAGFWHEATSLSVAPPDRAVLVDAFAPQGIRAAPVRSMPPAIEGCPAGWTPLVAKQSGPVLQTVLASFPQLPCFFVVDAAGSLLPPSDLLAEGSSYWIWVPNGASSPAGLLPPLHTLAKAWPLQPTCLPSVQRRYLLQHQGTCLADDQVSSALNFIAGCSSDVRVLEPFLLLHCWAQGCADPLRDFVPSMLRGCKVITCVPLKGHWVSFAWSILGGKIQAWVSVPGSFCAEEVSEVQWLWGRATGLTCRAFDFHAGPCRPPVPGLCGHYALADLSCAALGHPYQSDLDALGLASTSAASFEYSLHQDRLLRAPLVIASGAGDLIEQGLASLLRDRGVPSEKATARAAQALQRLGLGPIQTAMTSTNAWRCLKQLGNNATPAFQFVLQDELAQVVQARSATDSANKRQKKKPSARAGGGVASSPAPVAPQIDQIRIPSGVFASEGQPLHQVELQSIDTTTQGVVLVSPDQAAP